MTLLDLIEQCLLLNFEKEIYEKDDCTSVVFLKFN